MTAVNEHVCAAETECGAGTVYFAVLDKHVFVIVSRNAVIARVEFAFSDDNVLAGSDVNSVVTRFVYNLFNK